MHARSKLWHQIKDKNGKIKIGIDNILQEQVSFYSNLLNSEGWDEKAAEKLLENINTSITEEQKLACEKPISESELTKGIKALKTNKSPGIDGIPGEFYKKYWSLLKTNFIKVIEEIEETESLTISQYRGVICLIFKQGDRDDLKNWRPITLLNNDYKLIAIIYANRLKTILPSIIKDDQKAYIQGRQITESVRLTQDLINLCEDEDLPGAIIFLDQVKAYDRVEWGYLEKLSLQVWLWTKIHKMGFNAIQIWAKLRTNQRFSFTIFQHFAINEARMSDRILPLCSASRAYGSVHPQQQKHKRNKITPT